MFRVGHDAFQQGLEMSQHPGNRGLVKQVQGVFQRPLQSLLGVSHRQRQIKLRGSLLYVHLVESQPWDGADCRRGVLQCKHHLHQRRMARTPREPQCIYQFLKGQSLVIIGVQCDLRAPARAAPENAASPPGWYAGLRC